MKKLMQKKIGENSNSMDYKYKLLSLTITNYDIVKDGLGLKKANCLMITTLKRIEYHMKDNFTIGSSEIYVQLAMGVASFEEYSDTVESIIKNANIAKVYAAKMAESNIQFYTADLKNKYLENIKMKRLLRGALEKGEIYLTYQPQVELTSGQIVGTEALIRWKSPELGNISPVKFISIAEETGLILFIGEWVLNEACRQNKKWRDGNFKPILMSVNISPVQLQKQL